MKNCLKFLPLCLGSLLIFVHSAKSQSSDRSMNSYFFIHAIGAIPVDQSTKDRYSAAFGAEGGFGIGAKTTYFTASLGYLSCSADSVGVKTESYIPLKIGIRQYISAANVFFGALNIGAGFVSNSVPTKKTPSPSTTRLAGDIGIGAKLKNFEVGVSFDAFEEPSPDGTSGWVEAKLGWNFKLKKS